MRSSPSEVPVYRAITIVSTVLSRDEQGEMVHDLIVDTTSPEMREVIHELT